MKKRLFFLEILLAGVWIQVAAQPVVAEGFIGMYNYKYQHMFMRRFSPQGRFGYFNSSSLQVFHDEKQQTEVMSQSYITYQLSPALTAGAGTFYATGAGFRPSIALQIAQKKKDFFCLFFPRVDYLKAPAFELMMLFEYRPKLSDQLHLYSRLHVMSNYGPQHNRSFQNLVVGIDWNNTQVGFGLAFDEWGKGFYLQQNWGVLVKKELF